MPDIAFVKPALPRSGALVLPMLEGVEDAAMGLLRTSINEATGGVIDRALSAANFKARKGQSCTIWAPVMAGGAPGPNRVVAVGLGKQAGFDAAAAEAAGGSIAPLVSSEREALIAGEGLAPVLAASLGMGVLLRSYRFDRYRTQEKEEDRPKLERVAVATSDTAAAKAAWAPMASAAEGVHLARDLVSEPPNVLGPEELAERCAALEKHGIEVEVLGPKELRKHGFGALLGVAQGSAREPRVVLMHWRGASTAGPSRSGRKTSAVNGAKPLAFVGKGVTFDTGGISIKPAAGMEDMKHDMAGAAAVIGLMATLAGRRAKAEVVGAVGLVENMPSGTAQRPGDVVKTYGGQTVEVINTDAEGRLVLADLLGYVQDRYDPRLLVDLATLTGAIIVALGHEHAGLFASDDTLAQQIEAAGRMVNESCWRLPLGEAYDKQLKSDIADMKNVGGRPGSSVVAAQFIKRFVKEGRPWAHLDIAGTAWVTKDQATVPKGASGFGVRLLDRLVAEYYES
jgi:leucyl aminopeptidase